MQSKVLRNNMVTGNDMTSRENDLLYNTVYCVRFDGLFNVWLLLKYNIYYYDKFLKVVARSRATKDM